jgi:hypothetical protein
MKTIGQTILLLTFGLCAFAQQWEVGGIGGASFLNHVSVNNPGVGTATAGFSPGVVAGVFLGQNIGEHWSGEIRYEFFDTNLKLSGAGTSATFSGVAHAVHYDLLYHFTRKNSPLQFFVAAGGGMKVFVGSGLQEAFQPLQQFGYFTQTHQIKPMASVGGGLTYRIGDHLRFRAEIRDFISAFPTNVIAPPPGVTYGKMLNDIVPMAGISYLF